MAAGLLCYQGLVSLSSARSRPRRVGLRPLLHWPRSAARLVVGGRAPVRLACNAPAGRSFASRVLSGPIAEALLCFGARRMALVRFAQLRPRAVAGL